MTLRRSWQDCLREAVRILRNQDRSIWEQQVYDGLRRVLDNENTALGEEQKR